MKLNPIGEIIAQEWQATNKKRRNVKLHEYVIMPDHIHGIIEIKFPIQSLNDDVKFSSPKNTIGSIIRGFKSATTIQVLEYISKNELHWRRGELIFAPKESTNTSPTRRGELIFAPNASHEASAAGASELIFAQEKTFKTKPQFKMWQRGYHDRVIRDLDELKQIIRYLSENPMRWSHKMNEDSLL